MESAASEGAAYSRYGSTTFKQLYIYGALDTGPTILNRNFGFSWAVSGWLLTPFMGKAGKEVVGRMRKRVVDELTTTFASKYTQVIGLALDTPEAIKDFLTRVPVDYPILVDTPGPADASVWLGNRKGVLPYSVLVAADGKIVKQKIGPFAHGEIEGWAKLP